LNRWLVTVAVMLPTIMEVLDTSIVNVALPHMQGTFSATQDEITWVLTAYLVSNAIILPLSGFFSRLFGRKRYLLGCVVLFTIASVFCASTESLSMMVIWRIVQGSAGGALQPLSQAILLESFPEEQRGSAMAAWGVGIIAAPVIAPLLGGYITDHYSWHWVFLINLPIGVIATFAIAAFIEDPHYARRARVTLDAIGFALLVVGIGALQVVLDRGQQDDWFASRNITVLTALGVVCLVGFVIREIRAHDPIVDLSVLRDKTFSSGTGVMFLFGFGLYGTLTLIPLYVQNLLGYTAFQSGFILSPRGLGVITTMLLAGRLLRHRIDPRWLLLAGVPLMTAAAWRMTYFNFDTSAVDMITALVLQGFGMGFIFVPLSTASVAGIAPERMSAATGIFNLMRNVGGSVGISVTQTVLARSSQVHHLALAKHINPYDPVFQERLAHLTALFSRFTADAALARRRALAEMAAYMNGQAAMLAFDVTFWVFTFAFVAMVPLILRMRPGRGRAEPVMVH
jgi:DHA2 family multidrug resistance protein